MVGGVPCGDESEELPPEAGQPGQAEARGETEDEREAEPGRHLAQGRADDGEVDPDLIVPNDDLSLAEGAIAPWASGSGASEYFQRVLGALAEEMKFGVDVPWRALPERAKESLLHGRNHKVHVKYRNRFGRERSYTTGFEGAIQFVKRRHAETDSDWSRERYEGYMREVPCPSCRGSRLKPESLAVTIGGRSIADVCALPISDSARSEKPRVGKEG